MKKHLLLSCLVALLSTSFLNAQICEPDQMYADSAFGVYPPPYDSMTMMGGIDVSACINTNYFFALTLVIPEEIMIPSPPVTAQVNFIQLDEGNGVVGLPSGMSYACNPPDCKFEPEDMMGCAAIYGIADDTNAPGVYELSLNGEVSTSLGTFDLGLILNFLGAGSYSLVLEEEGSPDCFEAPVNVEEPLTDNISIQTAPNPFAHFTTIQIESSVNEQLQFDVFNLLGERVHSQSVTVSNGINTIEFDGSHLANGVYHFSFTDGNSVLTQKMLIQR